MGPCLGGRQLRSASSAPLLCVEMCAHSCSSRVLQCCLLNHLLCLTHQSPLNTKILSQSNALSSLLKSSTSIQLHRLLPRTHTHIQTRTCAQILTCTQTHKYMHTISHTPHRHTNSLTDTQSYTEQYIHSHKHSPRTHLHTHTRTTHTHIHSHTRTQARVHIFPHARTLKHSRTHIHALAHTHIHVHTHAHTHAHLHPFSTYTLTHPTHISQCGYWRPIFRPDRIPGAIHSVQCPDPTYIRSGCATRTARTANAGGSCVVFHVCISICVFLVMWLYLSVCGLSL